MSRLLAVIELKLNSKKKDSQNTSYISKISKVEEEKSVDKNSAFKLTSSIPSKPINIVRKSVDIKKDEDNDPFEEWN